MHLTAYILFTVAVPAVAQLYPCLTPWEQIHQTLTLYARVIDSKDFNAMSSVFTDTAFANYTGFLSNLTGLPAIEAGLEAAVKAIDTQHLLGSINIDIPEGRNDRKANSTTYFQASLFGKGNMTGKVLYQYGYYADNLVMVEGGGWRITNRKLIFLGPGMIGDLSVIGE